MREAKRQLRNRLRARLAELPLHERTAASETIAARLLALAGWADARVIMAYLSMPTEVQTRRLIDAAWTAGKRVAVPQVDWDRRHMHAVEMTSWADQQRVGRLGLVELLGGGPIGPDGIDLVLVPGLGFDDGGGRLGRGGGFFDRYLAQPELRAVTCGLAFECQRVDVVPREPTDFGLDLLVTESAVRPFTQRGRQAARPIGGAG